LKINHLAPLAGTRPDAFRTVSALTFVHPESSVPEGLSVKLETNENDLKRKKGVWKKRMVPPRVARFSWVQFTKM
jgi:hypothetical protein